MVLLGTKHRKGPHGPL